MDDLPLEAMGPKMEALGDARRRKFAWAVARGSNPTVAAREAGYSDHKERAKVQAHYLMHDQRVLDAIGESARKWLQSLGPVAISAARRILENAKHPAHARMIETVLDRTGFAAKTEHKVTVEHTADLRQLEALAQRLAAETGVDARRFLGTNVIEGKVVDGK